MTPEEAEYADLCLYHVWQLLNGRGIRVAGFDDREYCGEFTGVRSAQVDMASTITGTLVWTYVPHEPISPGKTARIALALLTSGPVASTELASSQRPLHRELARVLRACGLWARRRDFAYGDGELYRELVVVNPAAPGRGHVRVTRSGDIRWECPFRDAGDDSKPGLAAAETADAIAAALADDAGSGTDGKLT